MGRKTLRAGDYTVKELLSQFASHRFVVPVFQRTYQWEVKRQLKPFVDDLVSLAITKDESSHFFGSLVVQDIDDPIGPGSYDLVLVDGQQRSVTIALTLAALAVIEDELNPGKGLKKSYYEGHLMCTDKARSGQPKFSVTFLDRTQFSKVVKELVPRQRGLASGGELTGHIHTAYEYLKERLAVEAAKHPKGPLAGVRALREAVLTGLQIVLISLGDDDDPHQVFTSLNSKGKPLSVLDLVRSNVIGRIRDDQEIFDFYENTWRPLEDEFKTDPLLRRSGQAALDCFEQFIFPYSLSHNPAMPKNAVYNYLSNELWINGLAQPTDIVADMLDRSPAYLAVHPYPPEGIYKGALAPEFADLKGFEVTGSVFPFLINVELAVREGRLAAPMARKSIRWIEAFLVRRAICGYEPTGLHAVFKEAWKNSEGDVQKLDSFVRNRKTVEVPSDSMVEEALSTESMYTRSVCRALLLEYERSLVSPRKLSWNLLRDKADPYHIDHVMPQSIKAGWPGISTTDHERVKNLVGNLVLLEPALNLEKSNKTWSSAKKELAKSNMSQARAIARKTNWTVADVDKRTEQVAKWALTRFRYPK